jgi:hypothetical protein
MEELMTININYEAGTVVVSNAENFNMDLSPLE